MNIFRIQTVISVGSIVDFLIYNGNRANLLQYLQEGIIIGYIPLELGNDAGQRLPISVLKGKNISQLKVLDNILHFLFDFVAVCIQLGIAVLVLYNLIPLLFPRGRLYDTDALASRLHMAVKFRLPRSVSSNCRGIGPLEGNQNRIIKAVICETGHDSEIIFVFFTLKKVFDTLMQLLCNFFYLFILFFPFLCHNSPLLPSFQAR